MIGILTEKPSAGRNFAKALTGSSSTMSGTFNGESFIIVSARGHLYAMMQPEKQVAPALSAQYKDWSVTNLPWNEKEIQWKREKAKGASSLLADLKRTLSTCSEIVIATDVDPTGEGQLLAWEILDELNLRPKKYSRMYFTDEAEASLQKAFASRKPIASMETDTEYLKALYRSKWDYLSMQFTRIASKEAPRGVVLRQGRLKSSMVYLVGEQLDAIANYKKVPSYQNRFRDENGVVYKDVDEPVFPQEKDVPKKYGPSSVIVDSKTKKKTAPPRLIDLAGMSSILAGQGIKAKTVLETYQKMYEAKVVSYPRTEDKIITKEQFDELLPKIDAIANVVGIDKSLLTRRSPRPTHVKSGGAHGANRPGPNVPSSLDDLKKYGTGAKEIYLLLARNYLSMLGEDYEYEQQAGHLEKYPSFKGTVNVPLSMGYKAIFADTDEVDPLVGDGLGKIAQPFVHEGFPQKPSTPTMKWLMKQLEKHDVGTGATRTGIYADVTNAKSKYPLLMENRGKISMTDYGNMSYKLLPNTHIGNIKLTESLMQNMRAIGEGKLHPDQLLGQMQDLVRDDIKTMEQNGIKMRKDLGETMGKQFEEKEKFEGMWNGKQVRVTRVQRGYRLTDKECETLLDGGSVTCTFKSAAGKPYKMAGRLADLEYKGRKYVGIDFKFPEGVPDKWCGHTFTDEEKEQLEAGLSIFIEGFVSKKGNTFDANVSYTEGEDGKKRIVPEFN